MREYEHTQIGYFLIITYSVIILFMGFLNIVTDFHPIPLLGLLLMLIALGLFPSLTVKVDDRMIKIQFGLGVIRKNFPLRDIETIRAVKNPWYYGWGIRYTPRGWLYSVSGLSAIELQMKSGRKYRIGTDDPDKLVMALDQTLSDSSVSTR